MINMINIVNCFFLYKTFIFNQIKSNDGKKYKAKKKYR